MFDRPQIRKLIQDPNFILSMNDLEANGWKAFVRVIINSQVTGSRIMDYYSILVESLIKSFHSLGCTRSIKLNFLHSHLDKFLKTLETLMMNREKGFIKTLK